MNEYKKQLKINYNDLSEPERKRLKYLVNSNIEHMNASALYFAVINGIIKPNADTREYLKELCRCASTRLINQLSLENPVYVLIKLHMYGYLPDISSFYGVASKSLIFNFIAQPDHFIVSDFAPNWWPLLRSERVIYALRRSRDKRRVLFKKLSIYMKDCSREEKEALNEIMLRLE